VLRREREIFGEKLLVYSGRGIEATTADHPTRIRLAGPSPLLELHGISKDFFPRPSNSSRLSSPGRA